jgi:hypothetical protein
LSPQNPAKQPGDATGASRKDHIMPPPKIVFFVDQEKFEVETETLTVRQILVLAKEDPASTTLVEKVGNETIKHTDLDEVIHLKDGMKFVVFHNGPTPVS